MIRMPTREARVSYLDVKRAARLMCHCHFCPFLIVQSVAIDRSARLCIYDVPRTRKSHLKRQRLHSTLLAIREDRREKWRRERKMTEVRNQTSFSSNLYDRSAFLEEWKERIFRFVHVNIIDGLNVFEFLREILRPLRVNIPFMKYSISLQLRNRRVNDRC